MNKRNLIFWLVLLCMVTVGCASLKEAASQVTPEQQAAMQANLASAAPFIPVPYQIPVTAIAGWLACVAYNWFKNKTKPQE